VTVGKKSVKEKASWSTEGSRSSSKKSERSRPETPARKGSTSESAARPVRKASKTSMKKGKVVGRKDSLSNSLGGYAESDDE